ncbi:aminotransferase class V-fold PLP-dependent enzyme [Nocardioides sp. BP30]|uniref:cysteine desulfurase family protein n=1 Tax=Nocardioides sp. BP30 TaxID=3036374 RepID=UPI002468D7D4|nr:aminotransferase class V-fold PLP-dependent enzyme [Nocardioides sp. BP30]WGL53786.1 aminotransferase class V-fold PLP-dependent enzyme [Nocardioides sp. BP30]
MTNAAVYLDAASAEPLHPAARDTLLAALEHGYADPRRLHGPGRNARLLLDNAREVVAEALGVRRDEVLFTSSGTRAVQLGLLGLAAGRSAPALGSDGGRSGRRIVHTAVEHQAVTDAAAWWGEAVEVEVDPLGRVLLEQLRRVAPGAAAMAVQSANHEVGTVQPVAAAAQVAADLGVPLFVDACASLGRLPLPDGWDALAGSAHKWGGPAGVGVVLVRHRARWSHPFPSADPLARVDDGFPDVAGALAAAAALQAVLAEQEAVGARQRALIDLIRARVAELPDVDVVGDPEERLPHLVTFSFLYVDGEALVTELDRLGFGLASGSACATDTREPSRVLAAMGALTHGNVRLSLTRDADRAEVDRFLEVLPGVVGSLRERAGL